jgi:hypothetical protein
MCFRSKEVKIIDLMMYFLFIILGTGVYWGCTWGSFMLLLVLVGMLVSLITSEVSF